MASTSFASKSAVFFRPNTAKTVRANKPVVARKALKVVSHCQVPCGIFDDSRQIAKLKEDVATIRKAQTEMGDIGDASTVDSQNTFARWVIYKEKHADDIINEIGYYFMCQRFPKFEFASTEDYNAALAAHHAVMVAAMKAKQGTATSTCDALDSAIDAVSALPMYNQ
ncbi:hypothetical protein CYMTET_55020 [Cymbomonas tetramitiformis]|uniref:Superoxide dismutase n=1 Tax=Cymbomonas tetramitiformis TaxID=36881 RepID=A0AAE0BDR8_9CHLO|nr:hypothetical protein CYMTET_55020 [Cymbomonas tetramitiformis]|eukprot:gene10089-11941_t